MIATSFHPPVPAPSYSRRIRRDDIRAQNLAAVRAALDRLDSKAIGIDALTDLELQQLRSTLDTLR